MTREETIKEIISFRDLAAKEEESTNYIHNISIPKYCRMVGTMYEAGDYPTLLFSSLLFSLEKIRLDGGGGRLNIYFHDKEQDVFLLPIGVSLNEGLTETAAIIDTNQLFSQLSSEIQDELDIDANDNDRISDAYYFEILFYRSVCEILNIDHQQIAMEGTMEILDRLFEYTQSENPCTLYELLSTSDNLEWNKAEEIIEQWKKSH